VILTLAVVTAAGLVVGELVRRTVARRLGTAAPRIDGSADGDARTLARPDERAGLPCGLGDVVLLSDGQEAWLAGAVLLREVAPRADESGDSRRTVAALFVAGGTTGACSVYARPSPRQTLDWVWPLAADALALGSEPPSSIELEAERLERVRRVPVEVSSIGEGSPHLGARAILGEYEGGSGARVVVILGVDATAAWRGRRLEEGMYEVLPGSHRV
jgi:hypothetical protein